MMQLVTIIPSQIMTTPLVSTLTPFMIVMGYASPTSTNVEYVAVQEFQKEIAIVMENNSMLLEFVEEVVRRI